MSRPEFPNCIMPPNVISRIREEQAYYDQDPERYERREADRREQQIMEADREAEYQQQCQEEVENYHEEELNPKYDKDLDNDLPF